MRVNLATCTESAHAHFKHLLLMPQRSSEATDMKLLILVVSSLLLQTSLAQYLGPYIDVYPFTDIGQEQQNCVPDPAQNVTCPLYIALTSSFGGDFVSSGVIPGVQLALNQINDDPSILPGYTLHYLLTDSQVSSARL